MRKRKHPARGLGGLLCGLICVLLFGIAGTDAGAEIVKGKVASTQGDGIELDVGTAGGLGLGDEGRVYYTIIIDGKETSIFVGKFKVTEVSERTARGQIFDRTGEIKAGYAVEIMVRLGELEVTSEPSGATVYLDQKKPAKLLRGCQECAPVDIRFAWRGKGMRIGNGKWK